MQQSMLRNTKYAQCTSYCVFFILIGFLSACAPVPVTPFIPPAAPSATKTEAVSVSFATPTPLDATPTPLPQASATPAATSTDLPPSPTPACTDSLKWLEDVSVPDGSSFYVAQPVVKQWRVQNAGSCNWDSRYRLKLVSGEALGATAEMALFPAKAGAQVIIQINFTAPLEPGIYQTSWQAYNPDGQSFGDPVYMQIVVQLP
jgi:hypothetical protein